MIIILNNIFLKINCILGNDKVYCFCKSMDGLCNAGNIDTVLKELRKYI